MTNTEKVFIANKLAYEDVLNWFGFAFESSRELIHNSHGTIADVACTVDDGMYGDSEAKLIMRNSGMYFDTEFMREYLTSNLRIGINEAV